MLKSVLKLSFISMTSDVCFIMCNILWPHVLMHSAHSIDSTLLILLCI